MHRCDTGGAPDALRGRVMAIGLMILVGEDADEGASRSAGEV